LSQLTQGQGSSGGDESGLDSILSLLGDNGLKPSNDPGARPVDKPFSFPGKKPSGFSLPSFLQGQGQQETQAEKPKYDPGPHGYDSEKKIPHPRNQVGGGIDLSSILGNATGGISDLLHNVGGGIDFSSMLGNLGAGDIDLSSILGGLGGGGMDMSSLLGGQTGSAALPKELSGPNLDSLQNML